MGKEGNTKISKKPFLKGLLFLLLISFIITLLFISYVRFYYVRKVHVFSAAELTKFDGKEGKPAYFVYKGKVYDVTGSKSWKEGKHYSDHLAGTDLSNKMIAAPHGEEVLSKFPVVGILKGYEYKIFFEQIFKLVL